MILGCGKVTITMWSAWNHKHTSNTQWTKQVEFPCILHYCRQQWSIAPLLCVGQCGFLPHSCWNFGWLDLIQALCIQPQPCEFLCEMDLSHPPSPPKPLTLTISFCDDSQVLRRRDVARISHWGLNISVFNLCALASGDLSLDHRSTAERSSLMRVLLFFPLTQMQSYCGKQHDFCEKHSS